jgi:hypothetical protein
VRRRTQRCLAAAMLLAAGMAHAGSLTLVNSYWSPADFDEDYGPGVQVQGSFNPIYDVMLRIARFPDMGDDVITEAGPVEVDLAVTPIEIAAMAHLPYQDDPWIQPYFGAGLGYYQIDLSAKGPSGSLDYGVSDEVGVLLLAGLRLHLSPELIMTAEITQRWIEGEARGEESDGGSTSFDINLNGFGAGIGLGLFW